MTHAKLPPALRSPLSRNVALLLESRIPARLAWCWEGSPRVIGIWFVWEEDHGLSMATFAGSPKLGELRAGDPVAVSIDTESFPYRSLRLGGPIALRQTTGLAPEYRAAAARYLGADAGAAWCTQLDGRDQVVLRLVPTWATVSDMSRSPFLSEPV